MDEKEVRERFAKLHESIRKDEEPDEANILALVEGGLVNLARLANRP